MGLFDDFIDDDGLLRCAARHLPEQFQSKELQPHPGAGVFVLHEGLLYLNRWGVGGRPDRSHEFFVRGRRLIERVETSFRRVAYNDEALVYTFCRECEPVYYRGSRGISGDTIHEAEVWVEYGLRFRRGRLVGTRAVRVETRELARQKVAEYAVPLADDDPIVVRHRKLKGS